jgi:2-isopropylmalate synthase
MERIWIFDTTLRDGEQAPGFSMTLPEKIAMGRQLARLKVDVIEAGFPMASQGDFESVSAIAAEVEGPSIAGLCRAREGDIRRAWDAVRHSSKPRIHTFLATSDIHMTHKLRMTREQVLKAAVDAVALARSLTADVEFSAEDAARSDRTFLAEVCSAVIEAGAGVVNIPDTVGYAVPSEFGDLIAYLVRSVPGFCTAILSVHCHNDLGLGVANSVAAVQAGARQVECTINGIGERAGNAALEEFVMVLRTRQASLGFTTGIETAELFRSSRLLTRITGAAVQANKAIVGDNAFAHEAGIHQDGMLKDRTTYEIMTPESVGISSSQLILGKHSGRHAFSNKVEEMGYRLDKEQVDRVFKSFKDLADKKKVVYEEDIEAIINEVLAIIPQSWILERLQVTSGTCSLPTATVTLRKGEEVFTDAAIGDGPVDATCKAIDRITGAEGKLESWGIRAITEGKDAIGEAQLRVSFAGRVVAGKGSSTDVIESSAKAYLNALNKALFRKETEETVADTL